jgi:DNA polymerase-3 subunit epsilon
MSATWREANPYPAAEGDSVYEVLSTWRGHKCSTKVIGMPRVFWTMALWSDIKHDDIRYQIKDEKEDTMIDVQPTVQETPKPSDPALDAILQERQRQDTKWGEQNHDGEKWVLIATEELGEVCQALLKKDSANYMQELTQLAAVMLAWLQCEHRRGAAVPMVSKPVVPVFPSKIVRMERGETSNSKSPMWRCIDEDGDRVNVFKHSDPAKDSFKLFDEAGYGSMMELMKLGDVLTWNQYPIAVHMQKKGDWWNITHVEPMPVEAKPELARDDERAKAAAAQWAKDLLASGDFILLDTETTGLNRDGKRDEPVQIAIVASDGTVLLNTLVKPTVSVDDEAAATHHITAEMLANAPRFVEVHIKLHTILGYQKLVVYNAAFDNQILINAAQAAAVKPALYGGGWHCAMKHYAAFFGDWNAHTSEYKWHSLTKACEQQDITDIDAPAHSALGDCLRTLALIKKMAAYEQPKTNDYPF